MSNARCTLRGLGLLYALQWCSSMHNRAPPGAGVVAHITTTTTTQPAGSSSNGLSFPRSHRPRRLSSSNTLYLGVKEAQKLVAPDARSFDYFGIAVAVHGNYSVYCADGHRDDMGAAYLYRTASGGASWHLVHKIVPSDANQEESFGSAVAMDGDYFVIGAYQDSDVAFDAGSAYIYKTANDGETKHFQQKLIAPDAAAEAGFGVAVAMDANYIVVGAWGDGHAGESSGAAYIYSTTNESANWTLVHKIVASDAAAYDRFGIAVAIDANCIVVGAREDDDAGDKSGSAYIFSTTDGGKSWLQVQKLVAADGHAYAYFGCAVAVQRDVIAVGTWAGAAYIYVRSEGSWTQTQKIVPREDAAGALSVAISANTMVIGAGGDDGAAPTSGAAYIYRTTNDGKSWDFLQQIDASDAASYDSYGYTVAIDGNIIVVGSFGSDGAGESSGSAYTYKLLTCANFSVSDGDDWRTAYELRDASSGDIVEAGSVGAGGSKEICLVNGCYTVEVVGSNINKDRTWSFATLSSGAPYGPTPFVAIDGIISESTACSSEDSMTESIPAKSSKGSNSANGSDGALIGGIVAAAVFVVVLLGSYYWYRVVKNDKNAACCCIQYTFVEKLKSTFGATTYYPFAARDNRGPEHDVQLTIWKEESAASDDALRSTTANLTSAPSYDPARRGALRQALLGAKTKIQALRRPATPALEGVLCALQTTLEHVEALLHKADDIVAAGDRMISVVNVLHLLADTTAGLDTGTMECATVETCMNELKELLDAFAVGIQRFRDEGWLRQMWILLANTHSPSLAAVDAKILTKLDDLLLTYNIARDQHTDTILACQTYVLEEAMKEQIDRLVAETGKDARDAASALAENEAAILAVAEAAHIDKEELGIELHGVTQHLGSEAAHVDEKEASTEDHGALLSGANQGPSYV